MGLYDDFAKGLEEHDYQFEKGQVVRGKVVEYDAGGVYVDIGAKSPGFVPAAEVALKRTGELAEMLPLQEEMEFLIISNQNAEGQMTLSRRQLEMKQIWDKLAEMAAESHSVQIEVTGTNKGGIVGDVEGLKGFIPRSHLVEANNLDSLVGETLTATFLEVDRERNKLVLSQRQAVRAAAMAKIKVGELAEGTVASIKPYGLFVDLGRVTGLLHIRQVSNGRVESLEAMFKVGQQIKVMVMEIDEYKNRISLSTKILESYPGEILEHLDTVMANAEERAELAKENMSNQPNLPKPKIQS